MNIVFRYLQIFFYFPYLILKKFTPNMLTMILFTQIGSNKKNNTSTHIFILPLLISKDSNLSHIQNFLKIPF